MQHINSQSIYIITLLISMQLGAQTIAKNVPEYLTFDRETSYALNKCRLNKDCYGPCGNIKELIPLCDRNGTCICDCSDTELIPTQVPAPCASWIPSQEHDSCSSYCTQNYQRPSKICGQIGVQLFCTALCRWY